MCWEIINIKSERKQRQARSESRRAVTEELWLGRSKTQNWRPTSLITNLSQGKLCYKREVTTSKKFYKIEACVIRFAMSPHAAALVLLPEALYAFLSSPHVHLHLAYP